MSKPLVERHGAMPALAGTFVVGCLLSLPLAFWTWPGFSRFSARFFVRLARTGYPGAFHHTARLGLSKPLAAPV